MDWSPVWISLQTAFCSIVITFFLGIGAARIYGAMRPGRLKTLLDGLFILPMVMPPTVAGFALLYLFSAKRPLGILLYRLFDVKLIFTWQAAVLASAVISFPLMYRSARGALEAVDTDFVAAARTLGLSERQIFWRIKMPLAKPGLLSGAILSFSRGMGEFGATAMIAGNIAGKTRTLPLAVYSRTAAGDMEGAGFYAVLIGAFSLILIALMDRAGTARYEKSGRREKR